MNLILSSTAEPEQILEHARAAEAAGAALDCAAGDGNAIVAPADAVLLDELAGAPGEPGSAGSL